MDRQAIGATGNDLIRLVCSECLLIGVPGVSGALFTSAMNVVGRPFIVARLSPGSGSRSSSLL
jgi:hypothetical protein